MTLMINDSKNIPYLSIYHSSLYFIPKHLIPKAFLPPRQKDYTIHRKQLTDPVLKRVSFELSQFIKCLVILVIIHFSVDCPWNFAISSPGWVNRLTPMTSVKPWKNLRREAHVNAIRGRHWQQGRLHCEQVGGLNKRHPNKTRIRMEMMLGRWWTNFLWIFWIDLVDHGWLWMIMMGWFGKLWWCSPFRSIASTCHFGAWNGWCFGQGAPTVISKGVERVPSRCALSSYPNPFWTVATWSYEFQLTLWISPVLKKKKLSNSGIQHDLTVIYHHLTSSNII